MSLGLILASAMITFIMALLLLDYAAAQTMRRIVGQWRMKIDVCMHVGILALFLGTGSTGLLQAEAAGIGVTLYLRWYAKYRGLERRERRAGRMRWVRYDTSVGLPSVEEAEAEAEVARCTLAAA